MKYLAIIIISIVALTHTGCYYDKNELINGINTCDTAIVTYSGSIAPLMSANCTGCHSGSSAPSGVMLNNHAGVRAVALTPRLMGVITHAAGFSPMPKNGTKLSNCNIEKVRKWIRLGALNN